MRPRTASWPYPRTCGRCIRPGTGAAEDPPAAASPGAGGMQRAVRRQAWRGVRRREAARTIPDYTPASPGPAPGTPRVRTRQPGPLPSPRIPGVPWVAGRVRSPAKRSTAPLMRPDPRRSARKHPHWSQRASPQGAPTLRATREAKHGAFCDRPAEGECPGFCPGPHRGQPGHRRVDCAMRLRDGTCRTGRWATPPVWQLYHKRSFAGQCNPHRPELPSPPPRRAPRDRPEARPCGGAVGSIFSVRKPAG